MEIARIYIACCAKDFYFTQLCVTSIREVYPDIPISLIKDLALGDFDTRDLERKMRVELYASSRQMSGWGFSKFEAWFQKNPEHFLVIDSDVAFLGGVLSRFDDCTADVVVSPRKEPPDLTEHYFDLPLLQSYDPDYEYPRFTFNSGQIVGRGGLIDRDDFAELVDWQARPPVLRRGDIFKCADQGIVNYLFARLAARGRLTIDLRPFYHWGGNAKVDEIPLEQIKAGDLNFMVHWSGATKNAAFDQMHGRHILEYFRARYVERMARP